MSYHMSGASLSKIRHGIVKLQAQKQRIRAKAEEKAGEMKITLETQAACASAAYLMGRIETKTGKPLELFGVPADGLVGAGLVAAAFLDLTGKYDEDMLNIGNGVLSAFVARKAYTFGVSAAKEGRFLGANAVGNLFGAGHVRAADHDLAEELRRSA